MKRRLALLLMIGVFLLINVWTVYTYITSRFPGANDFFLRYQGARSYLLDGLNPYSREATDRVEIGLYGHVAEPGQYPGDFVYPFYTIFLVAPLALLPYAVASAIWMVLLGTFVVASFWLVADEFAWRPPGWLLILGLIWSLILYPSARGMFLGQPGTLVACLELITLWALCKGRDSLAGVVLAISTLKPSMGYLIVPFLLLWALATRRWRFIGSFAALLAVMVGASFLLLPSWLSDWLAQVVRYPSYTEIESPVWVITSYYLPFLGRAGEVIIDAALVGLMLWAWYRVLVRRDQRLFDWTIALTLTVTHLVTPRTATPHFVVFSFVYVFYFRQIMRADRRWGALTVTAIMAAILVVLWLLFLSTVSNRFEHPIMYLPLPIGSLLLLWFTRRTWWRAAGAAV
jgi:hypothetical protein